MEVAESDSKSLTPSHSNSSPQAMKDNSSKDEESSKFCDHPLSMQKIYSDLSVETEKFDAIEFSYKQRKVNQNTFQESSKWNHLIYCIGYIDVIWFGLVLVANTFAFIYSFVVSGKIGIVERIIILVAIAMTINSIRVGKKLLDSSDETKAKKDRVGLAGSWFKWNLFILGLYVLSFICLAYRDFTKTESPLNSWDIAVLTLSLITMLIRSAFVFSVIIYIKQYLARRLETIQ